MIDNNYQLKSQFENYDEMKNNFYSQVIEDIKENNVKELDG